MVQIQFWELIPFRFQGPLIPYATYVTIDQVFDPMRSGTNISNWARMLRSRPSHGAEIDECCLRLGTAKATRTTAGILQLPALRLRLGGMRFTDQNKPFPSLLPLSHCACVCATDIGRAITIVPLRWLITDQPRPSGRGHSHRTSCVCRKRYPKRR